MGHHRRHGCRRGWASACRRNLHVAPSQTEALGSGWRAAGGRLLRTRREWAAQVGEAPKGRRHCRRCTALMAEVSQGGLFSTSTRLRVAHGWRGRSQDLGCGLRLGSLMALGRARRARGAALRSVALGLVRAVARTQVFRGRARRRRRRRAHRPAPPRRKVPHGRCEQIVELQGR